jgi:hypothetical protein
MATRIHFGSGEHVTVHSNADEVLNELRKSGPRHFARFVTSDGLEVYVASEQVAYVSQLSGDEMSQEPGDDAAGHDAE